MFRGFDKTTMPDYSSVSIHFDGGLTDEEHDYMRSKFRHYYFVTDREDPTHGTCSACQEESRVYYKTRHNEDIVCPKCGAELPVIHVWRGVKKCFQSKMFYLYEKSVLDKDVIGCRVMLAYMSPGKELKMEGECARIHYFEDSRTIFIYGLGAMQVEKRGEGEWEKTRSLTERRGYNPTIFTGDVYTNRKLVKDAIRGTPFAWSNWEGFDKAKGYHQDAYIKYFDLFAKYEAAEYLMKIGMFWVIKQYIYGGDNRNRCIRWHGNTPNEIFGIRTTKDDRKYLHDHAGKVYIETLAFWTMANRTERISLREAMMLETPWKRVPELVLLYVTGRKAVKYLTHQQEQGSHANIVDYEDYLRECLALGLDMREKSTLFPRDLLQAHRNLSAQIKLRENAGLEEKWQKRRQSQLKKYSFRADGLMVVIPEHITDLIAEGKMQHNCVGGYMDRVAEGRTDVAFIRREAEPEASYITMEISLGKVIQARTKNNGPLDEEGKAFVELFVEKVLEKETRVRLSA